MLEFNSNFVVTLALVILITWAWKILNSLWFRPKKLERYLRGQGLKGNPYRLWYGDLKDIKNMTLQEESKPIKLDDDILPHVVPFYHFITQKYGKKSFIWNGTSPVVNIMDPVMIKEILLKYNIFHKTKANVNPLAELLLAGIVFSEGKQWAKHRQILSPAFYMEKLKLMVPAMSESCDEIVGKWESLVTEKGWCEVDVWPFLENLSADVISRTAFGSNYEEGKQIFQLLSEQTKVTFQMIQSVYVPGWRFLPTKMHRRVKKINGEIRALLRDLISRKEKQMKAEEMKGTNLLSMLIESNLKEIEDDRKKFSVDEVIDNCKVFYFAGQVTTLSLLAWTMVMLGRHQNWQERAREEVLQVFGKNVPDFEGLIRLKIVTMILNEVLRLYPPSTVLFRTPQEKIKIGDITLPQGMGLLLHILLVHHDTEIWGDDAKEFKPERFSSGVTNAAKKPNGFIPFGSGPRICIGQNFAMIETKMALVFFLQRFSFELSPSYTHAPYRGVNLQPRFGVKMMLYKI